MADKTDLDMPKTPPPSYWTATTRHKSSLGLTYDSKLEFSDIFEAHLWDDEFNKDFGFALPSQSARSSSECVIGGRGSEDESMDEALLPGTEDDYVTGVSLAMLMTGITLGCLLVLLDMSIIVTAIPKITTYFKSLPDVGWYGSAYNLSSAALQPLSGKFYTYFNAKWTFLSFLFLFEVGSLICGVAQSSMMLIIGRAVAGLGSSGIQNGALSIIAFAAPMEKRPALTGLVMGGSQLGLVMGPLVGGAITQYTTWRWCFYLNFPAGGLAAVLMLFTRIPDRRVRYAENSWKTILGKLDLPGFAIFAPFAIMFLLALEYGGNEHPWDSPTVTGLFAGGAVIFGIFVWWERRIGYDAMIPLPIVRKKPIWTSCLSMFFLFTTVCVSSYYMPIYFQSIKGLSPFKSGIYMFPTVLSQLFVAIASGFLIQKLGYYMPFALVSAVILAVGNGLIAMWKPNTPALEWAGYQVVVGAGRGLGIQTSIIAIQANTVASQTATAMATLVFSQTFGGAIILAIANSIFNNQLKRELELNAPTVPYMKIVDAGATGIREVVSKSELVQVLHSYAKSYDSVFYLIAATSVCMFFASLGMGWTDIRKKKDNTKEEKV